MLLLLQPMYTGHLGQPYVSSYSDCKLEARSLNSFCMRAASSSSFLVVCTESAFVFASYALYSVYIVSSSVRIVNVWINSYAEFYYVASHIHVTSVVVNTNVYWSIIVPV